MTTEDIWVKFTTDDWYSLVQERNLRNCLKISTDVTDEKWSGLPSISFPLPEIPDSAKAGERDAAWNAAGFRASSPNPSAEIHVLSTYDKTVNSYHESGYDITSANVGVPGIASGSVTTKESHSHEETFSATDVYVTTLYKVPKVRLLLDLKRVELDEEFVGAMDHAIAKGEEDGGGTGPMGIAKFKDMYIREVLAQFGHYIVTDITLGGLLRATATKSVTSHKEADEFSESVKASFSADLSAFDVPVSGGASAEHGSTKGESHEQVHEKVTLDVTAIGGSAGSIKKYPEWAESLDPYDRWHIIRTGSLVPVINLLPDGLAQEVAGALITAEGYRDYTSGIQMAASSILDD